MINLKILTESELSSRGYGKISEVLFAPGDLVEIDKDKKYAVDRSFNNSKVNKFHLNHEYLSKKI